MVIKASEVKVQVNKDKKVVKKGVHEIEAINLSKDKVKAAPALKKTVKKHPKRESGSKITERRQKKSFPFMSLFLTALIAGCVVYFIKDRSARDDIMNIQQDARQTRIDFESRMVNLNDKLKEVEDENSQLKSENDELKEKTVFLQSAKKEYSDKTFGFSFEYPAVFGDFKSEIKESENGMVQRGVFSENDEFISGAAESGFRKSGESRKYSILDIGGYLEEDGKYYYNIPGEAKEDFELNPFKVIDFSGGKALILSKKSILGAKGEDLREELGENVAAVFNLNNENWKGMILINSDFSVLPLEEFIKMIESIKIIN